MQNKNYKHLNILERNASIFWREINPKANSCTQLKRLLEMYATFENWEKVINLSSRAVLHLDNNQERVDFYYIWICALYETQDILSLVHLAKHLIRMGAQYPLFNCLAAIAYNFAGKNKITLGLLKEQKKSSQTKNRYYKEALGLFLSASHKKEYIKKGIILLKKICMTENTGYLVWRNCLQVLSQHNCEKSMSQMYNLMHVKFPFAQEPYLTSALIAINEKKWDESVRLLKQIIKDNPENKEAILALAQSYEENNEHENAFEIITNNKHLFHAEDYDYNYAMARLLGHSAQTKNNKDTCEQAILCYDKAISLANFFHFPVEKLEEAKIGLELLNKNLEIKNKLLFSLETFLEKKEPLSLTSMLSLQSSGRHLKLGSK